MAINSLYPSFISIFYSTPVHVHKMTLPVRAYQGVGGVWFCEKKGGGFDAEWSVELGDFVTVLKPILSVGANISRAELWTYPSETADPVFREAFDINQEGTNGAATLPYGQDVFSFRSENGGVAKIYVMEPAGTNPNVRLLPPYGAGIVTDLAGYVIGDSSIIIARDGGFLIAPIAYTVKTNDRLRKRYLLDS